MKRSGLLKKATRFILIILSIAGVMLLFAFILAFTTRPFYTHHWLGTGISNSCNSPEAIILFGAGGMPSGDNMMRIYYAAAAWHQFPECPVYVCLPGDTTDEKGSLALMKYELKLRGVDPNRIYYALEGKNTRAQALDLFSLGNGLLQQKCLLVVTSPGHMRRSLLTLKKAGFDKLISLPAFEIPLEGELRFDDRELGGERRIISPSAGQTLTLRYEIWTQLDYQLVCAREFVALAYYWMRGWI